jgi:hypothetical protein
MKHHPKIRIRVIDIVRSRGGETQEQPELNNDQHQRENDAGQRHRESHFVVEQIPSGQQPHGPRSCFGYVTSRQKVTSLAK